MEIFKHVLYFTCGLLSVLLGILLLGLYIPRSVFGARFVALLPFIIPSVIAILIWKRSWAFAAGVASWILYVLITWWIS